MRHTITIEIELDVDAPEGTPWTQDVKDAVEDTVHALLRAHVDGSDISVGGATLHVDGHSTVAVPNAWPYR